MSQDWDPNEHPRYPETGEFSPKGSGQVIIGRREHPRKTRQRALDKLALNDALSLQDVLQHPQFGALSAQEKFAALGNRNEEFARNIAASGQPRSTAALENQDSDSPKFKEPKLEQLRDKSADKEVTSALQGLSHFVQGSKEPLFIPFEKIDTSSVRPSQFKSIQRALAGPARDQVLRIDDTMPFTARWDYPDLLGDITLRLQGQLQLTKEGSWHFNGTLKSYDDFYDMNRASRSFLREQMTTVGRKAKQIFNGADYWIEIHGTKTIQESGRFKPASLPPPALIPTWQKPQPIALPIR